MSSALHQVPKAADLQTPDLQTAKMMGAVVFQGVGKRSFEQKPKPQIQLATDAVVKITKTTICGTDLHILKGDVPSVSKGRILGHEGIGVIDSVGSAVSFFKPGDLVLISCITSCGKCEFCKKGMYSHCEQGGWILGNKIDGTQAEYVRIPFADTSLHKIPDEIDTDSMVLLSDVLPTAYECGVLNGHVQPGDQVAIVGAGPIGLASLMTVQFFSPTDVFVVDTDDSRLETAKSLGATAIINSQKQNAVERILQLTEGQGVQAAIEAVGIPDTFDICQKVVASGGSIANVGVHGKSVELHLEDLWSKNITIKTRLVDTETTPLLMKTIKAGMLEPSPLITHHFSLQEAMSAYETFESSGKKHALKVIMMNK